MTENMKKKETTKKDLRQFGLVLALILGLIGYLQLRKGHVNVYPWLCYAGGMSLIFGILLPGVLKPVFIVFTHVAHAIGWFNTRVILILVYYLILTPIGLLMRVFGKDILDQRLDGDASSYWIKRSRSRADKISLEKQF